MIDQLRPLSEFPRISELPPLALVRCLEHPHFCLPRGQSKKWRMTHWPRKRRPGCYHGRYMRRRIGALALDSAKMSLRCLSPIEPQQQSVPRIRGVPGPRGPFPGCSRPLGVIRFRLERRLNAFPVGGFGSLLVGERSV